MSTNLELWQKYQDIMPGMHSNAGQSSYGFKKPHFIVKAKGAHVWDADGDEEAGQGDVVGS